MSIVCCLYSRTYNSVHFFLVFLNIVVVYEALNNLKVFVHSIGSLHLINAKVMEIC